MSYQQGREEPRAEAAAGRSGPSASLILFCVVVALGVIFFLGNAKHLELNFFAYPKTTTVRWAIIFAVLLGVLLDRLFTMWWRRRGNRK